MDESPKHLIGETKTPIPAKSGSEEKFFTFLYKRHLTTGFRIQPSILQSKYY